MLEQCTDCKLARSYDERNIDICVGLPKTFEKIRILKASLACGYCKRLFHFVGTDSGNASEVDHTPPSWHSGREYSDVWINHHQECLKCSCCCLILMRYWSVKRGGSMNWGFKSLQRSSSYFTSVALSVPMLHVGPFCFSQISLSVWLFLLVFLMLFTQPGNTVAILLFGWIAERLRNDMDRCSCLHVC